MWWFGAVSLALAGEGMWLPEQVPALAGRPLVQGVGVPLEQLADPKGAPRGAVAGLGFCTASFVSPDGLLLTNAHCVDGFLVQSSTPERDRVAEGHAATSRADELPAGPAARLRIVESITDVTATIGRIVADPRVPDAERAAAVDREKSRLVARCERQRGRSCVVVPQYGGQTWQLVQRLELRDVRIVYAPPAGVAFFGGDADNFEWPRHDADFALLRAWVGPDGAPADPAEDNVPYRPPRWLPVDPGGVGPGEAVVVAGYPGGTSRYALPERLAFVADVEVPAELARYAEAERIVAEEMGADPVAARKLGAIAAGLANGRKYDEGIRDNLAATSIREQKAAQAARIDQRVGSDPDGSSASGLRDPGLQRHRDAVAALRRIELERQAAWPTRFAVEGLLELSLLRAAHTGYRWACERAVRPDARREPGYQDRDRDEILAELDELDAELWLPYERRLALARLESYGRLPGAQRIEALDAWLAELGGPEAAIAALFDRPALAAAEGRRALLGQPRDALERSADPWVKLAVLLERAWLAEERAREKARLGEALRHAPLYVELVRHERGEPAYPDANNTLRVTFGEVVGYTPQDGLLATPQTRMAGLVAKDHTPEYEAPDALRAAATRVLTAPTEADRRWFDPALGDVPLNFLSDVDTTGGNSGSPTLNGAGELVGVVFDGNYESMAADWQFDPATTRSVHVDIRYVGWLLSQDPAAAWIVDELFPRPEVTGPRP